MERETDDGADPGETDLKEELRLIRQAIERYRRSSVWSFVLSGLTVVALIVSVTVGVITQNADQHNANRDRENLVRLVRTGCEDGNDRAVTNAEVLINTVLTSAPDMSEETRQLLDEYRKNTEESLTNCDERVAIITGD